MKKINKSESLSKNIIWNTTGSLVYFSCQWILSILIIRLGGSFEDAGLFALSMVIGNVFFTISAYSVRSFQVSDIKNQFKNEIYISHRIIFIILSFVGCILFCILFSYNVKSILTISAYLLYKCIESFDNVLSGIQQKTSRMDIIGKSFIFRGLITLLSFTASFYVFKDLFISFILMTLPVSMFVFLYEIRLLCQNQLFKIDFNLKSLLSLTTTCFPLLLYGLATTFIPTIPKIYFENIFGHTLFGYYSSVATPAVIIQVFATFIFTPLLTELSKYHLNNIIKFKRLIFKVFFILITIGFIALMCSVFLGNVVLKFIFGNEISDYTYLLNTTIITALLVSIVWFISMVLTIMRRLRILVISSILSLISCIVFTFILIPVFAIDGINYVIIISFFINIVCNFIFNLSIKFKDKGSKNEV